MIFFFILCRIVQMLINLISYNQKKCRKNYKNLPIYIMKWKVKAKPQMCSLVRDRRRESYWRLFSTMCLPRSGKMARGFFSNTKSRQKRAATGVEKRFGEGSTPLRSVQFKFVFSWEKPCDEFQREGSRGWESHPCTQLTKYPVCSFTTRA